jgi:hypothetical protein
MKTNTLTGAALDWAVAQAEGGYDERDFVVRGCTYIVQNYSTNWAQGGPIIEREGIRLHRSHTGDWWAGPESDPHRPVSGPTPLIAAMRCYVASKLGDEVDIPEELK